VHVLSNMVQAIKPGGLVFDLQVIRPNPIIETNGRIIGEIDGEPLFQSADAATAAIDTFIRGGRLVEEAVDDHDVREHHTNGAALIADFTGSKRSIPDSVAAELNHISETCTVRERCRLRRFSTPRA
jgi:hypothetical protein